MRVCLLKGSMESDMNAIENLHVSWPTILNFSKNGIVLINNEGVILFYNRAAKAIFGEPLDEDVVGRHIAEIKPDVKHIYDL